MLTAAVLTMPSAETKGKLVSNDLGRHELGYAHNPALNAITN